MAQDWTNFKNHITEGDDSYSKVGASKMITTDSLDEDSSIDDIISKINTLISQLKGLS